MINCTLTKKRGKLSIDGEFTIFNVAELKIELLNALRSNKRLELSLDGVTAIDSAGVQILVMLKREAQRDAREFDLTNHSQAVLELIDLYNLASTLGDPILEPESR